MSDDVAVANATTTTAAALAAHAAPAIRARFDARNAGRLLDAQRHTAVVLALGLLLAGVYVLVRAIQHHRARRRAFAAYYNEPLSTAGEPLASVLFWPTLVDALCGTQRRRRALREL